MIRTRSGHVTSDNHYALVSADQIPESSRTDGVFQGVPEQLIFSAGPSGFVGEEGSYPSPLGQGNFPFSLP